jgi:sterol desaturase/sphingolipid hydroxylase (fatty acid hydroxylase superfamily)
MTRLKQNAMVRPVSKGIKYMSKRKWTHILTKLLTLFLVGYCTYIALEVTYRNVSYPLMGCVGGISLLLFDQINNKISWNLDLILQGFIGSAIVTSFELFVGEALKVLNHPLMWDYSNMPFNYDGVICLPFSIVWIIITILGILVADAYNYYLFHEEPRPYYWIIGHYFVMPKRYCDGE